MNFRNLFLRFEVISVLLVTVTIPVCSERCAPGCSASDETDSTCQQPCLYSACGYDGGSCDLGCILAGCASIAGLGNGICDPSCNIPDCGFDYLDCVPTCNSGKCPLSAKGDGNCNLDCNNADCNWDNGDCDCYNAGCPSTIPDDECIPECNVPICTAEVAECSSDVGALTKHDLSYLSSMGLRPLFDSRLCKAAHPTCGGNAALADSFCDNDCDNIECLWDGGDCFNLCHPNCSNCFGPTKEECWICNGGFKQAFTSCLASCPTGMVPTGSNCILATDTSTSANPCVMYVKHPDGSEVFTPAGTLAEPYLDLAQALHEGTWCAYTKIYLLGGTHLLDDTWDSWRNPPDFKSPLTYSYKPLNASLEIAVATYFCDPPAIADAICIPYSAGNRAVISFRTLDMVISVVNLIHFDNVILSGATGMRPTCALETCQYCPHLSTVGPNTFNDLGVDVTASLADYETACAANNTHRFIVVDGSTAILKMTKVLITEVRWQPASLIYLKAGGSIDFTTVDMTNVQAYEAFISTDRACASYNCFTILYDGGTIDGLNRGYNWRTDIFQSGLFFGFGVASLTLRNLTFQNSLVLAGDTAVIPAVVSPQLITLDRTLRVDIDGCTFNHVMGRQGAILNYTTSSVNMDATPADHNISPHVIFRNSTVYRAQSLYHGVAVYLNFATQLQNVEISNVTFNECVGNHLTTSNGIVYAIKTTVLLAHETSGGTIGATTVNPKTISLTNGTTFSNCYVNGQVLYSKNLSKIVVSNTSFLGNTFFSPASVPFSAYVHYRDTVGTLNTYIAGFETGTGSCISAIYFDEDFDILFEQDSSVTTTICDYGAVYNHLHVNSFTMSYTTVSNNKSYVQLSAAVNLYTSLLCTIDHCTMVANENVANTTKKHGGAVQIAFTGYKANLVMKSTTIDSSISGEGSAIYAVGGQIDIQSCNFSNNEAKTADGGAIYFIHNGDVSSMLSITGSTTFQGNKAKVRAADIFIKAEGNTISPFSLVINDAVSTTGNADISSFLYIDATVVLNSSIVLKSFRVESHTVQTEGTVGLNFSSGVILFDSCVFKSNKSSTDASAIVAHYGPDKPSPRSYVTLKACQFIGNEGDSVVHLYDYRYQIKLFSEASLFQQNKGVAVINTKGLYEDKESTFQEGTSEYGPGVYTEQAGISTLKGSKFYQNTATNSGGAVLCSGQSKTYLDSITGEQNKANVKGGTVYVEQNGYVESWNSTYRYNRANRGSVLFIISSYEFSEFRNCTMSYNNASSGTIGLLESNFTLRDSTLLSNTADYAGSINLILSNLTMIGTNHSVSSTIDGGFVLATSFSTITVETNQFKQAKATGYGGVFYLFSTALKILNSYFEDNEATEGGVIFSSSESDMTIAGSTIISSNATTVGACISSKSGSLSLSGSTISDFTTNALYMLEAKLINVVQTKFFNGGKNTEDGGAIFSQNADKVSITNSDFEKLVGKRGGAVFLEQSKATAKYTISGCQFKKNTGYYGGGVYATNLALEITDSFFGENGATVGQTLANSGRGGGLKVDCPDKAINCTYDLNETVFQYNWAQSAGGATDFGHVSPNYNENSFTFNGNSAPYGKDKASYATHLLDYAKFSDANSNNRNRRDRHLLVKTVAASGQVISDPILLALTDINGQLVSNDNTSEAFIELSNARATLSGNTRVTAVNGVFNFSEFTITYQPGDALNISISTDGIDQTNIERLQFVPSSDDVVEMTLRLCKIGEIALPNGACFRCEAGTYSIDVTDTECQNCPSEEAICYGGSDIVPKEGYWRENAETAVFYKCFNADACIGSPDSPESHSYTGQCETGYTGKLCAVCDDGYSESTSYVCEGCPSTGLNIATIVLIFIAIVVVIAFLVKTTLDAAYKPKEYHSVYLKIFANYIQLLVLTASFDLDWPKPVLELLSHQEQIGTATDQIFSFDCLLDQYGESIYFQKLVIMALLPFIIFFIAFAFWGVVALIQKHTYVMKNQLITTLVVVLFLIHPNLVRILFTVFSCKKIEGTYYLMESMDIECWIGDHFEYSLMVGLPAILVWGIGIPAMCLFFIGTKYRNSLDTVGVKSKFGFIYIGYKENTYFWEFIILYRKIIIVFISVFLRSISIPIQALTVIAVLIVSIQLHIAYSPYETYSLNQTELRAILVSFITIYCGLFFMTGDLEQYSKMILFCVIVFINFFFVMYWAKQMIEAGGELISRNLPAIRRMFCPFIKRPNITIREEVLQGRFHKEKSPNPLLEPRSCLVSDKDPLINFRYFKSPNELYIQVVKNILNSQDAPALKIVQLTSSAKDESQEENMSQLKTDRGGRTDRDYDSGEEDVIDAANPTFFRGQGWDHIEEPARSRELSVVERIMKMRSKRIDEENSRGLSAIRRK